MFKDFDIGTYTNDMKSNVYTLYADTLFINCNPTQVNEYNNKKIEYFEHYTVFDRTTSATKNKFVNIVIVSNL